MNELRKGHRPPPNGGIIGKHEPCVEGFNQAEFDASESGRTAKENMALYFQYKDGNEMDPALLAHWESFGVKKELYDADHDQGRFRYTIHTPTDLKPDEKLPLLYYSHGGNGNPLGGESVGFSKLIATERFMVVYPHNGGVSNDDVATEFPRIIAAIKEKGYPVDWSRVYASGYSSGSDATETIATLWPEMVAAVAPCPGSNAMYNSLCRQAEKAYEKCLPLKMPCCFVGGTADFGDRFPYPDEECFENFNIWAEKICKVSGYQPMTLAQAKELVKETADPVVRALGLVPQKTWAQYFEGRDWFFGEYFDANGNAIIRFVLGDNVPHVTTGCHAALVWDYLKHWSRDLQTKECIYTPVILRGVR